VLAVTPFNFTSIAGNLPTAPALMGNTVLWKPASSAVYSAYHVMKVLMAAGLPDGVVNMVVGSGSEVGDLVLASPELAGIHFTGFDCRVPADVEDGRRQSHGLPGVPPYRGRDRRKRLCRGRCFGRC